MQSKLGLQKQMTKLTPGGVCSNAPGITAIAVVWLLQLELAFPRAGEIHHNPFR